LAFVNKRAIFVNKRVFFVNKLLYFVNKLLKIVNNSEKAAFKKNTILTNEDKITIVGKKIKIIYNT
jgi:hypothetical protein